MPPFATAALAAFRPSKGCNGVSGGRGGHSILLPATGRLRLLLLAQDKCRNQQFSERLFKHTQENLRPGLHARYELHVGTQVQHLQTLHYASNHA